MGLSVWRETSKKLTVYRVCYTPIETLLQPPGGRVGGYFPISAILVCAAPKVMVFEPFWYIYGYRF